MPAGLPKIAGFRGWQPVARRALAAMACLALASCGSGPGSGHPDLTVVLPDVSDNRPAAKKGFTFSATVHNVGRGNAAASTLRVSRAKDAAVTHSDKEATAAVTELPALESVVVKVPLTAPAESGTYFYRACVDAQDGESDTANNCSQSVRVTVPDALAASIPDLVLEPPEVSNAGPASGDEFMLSVLVRNAGSATAMKTEVRFHRSADEAIAPSDPVVDTETIAVLAASASHVASVKLTAPSPGTYYYGACVDAQNEESDTANHCSAAVPVTVPPPPPPQIVTRRAPGPDLVMEAIKPVQQALEPPGASRLSLAAGSRPVLANAGPEPVLANSRWRLVVAYVRNAGDVRSPASTVRIYQSTDSTITTSDTQRRIAHVIALAPMQREWVGGDIRTPLTPGTYYYGLCVDAVAGETDTTNNCLMTHRITVSPRPPDLTIAIHPQGLYPTSPAIGGVFSLTAILKNTGHTGQAEGWVSLRYYRSDDAEFTSSDPQVGLERVELRGGPFVTTTVGYLETPSTTGTYYYRVCADAVAGESNTSNNCSSPVKVEVTHDKPNLVIKSNWHWHSGNSVVMVLTAANVGSPIDEDKRWLRFYYSTDATITTSDTEVGAVEDRWTSPLSGFDFLSGGRTITIPDTPGTHYFGGCVDVAAGEFDTTDNCSQWPLWFQR